MDIEQERRIHRLRKRIVRNGRMSAREIKSRAAHAACLDRAAAQHLRRISIPAEEQHMAHRWLQNEETGKPVGFRLCRWPNCYGVIASRLPDPVCPKCGKGMRGDGSSRVHDTASGLRLTPGEAQSPRPSR
jgi:hypothetical protein